jgi:hypothetical protein
MTKLSKLVCLMIKQATKIGKRNLKNSLDRMMLLMMMINLKTKVNLKSLLMSKSMKCSLDLLKKLSFSTRWMKKWVKEKAKLSEWKRSASIDQICHQNLLTIIDSHKNGRFQIGSKSNQLMNKMKWISSSISESVKERPSRTLTIYLINSS